MDATEAALAIPFGHVADLFLCVAELFLLWKAVSAWRVFLALWYNVEGPTNDPHRCPWNYDSIPPSGITGTAKEICAKGGYSTAGGWYWQANCHGLDCTGGTKEIVNGWTVSAPLAGTKPDDPFFCKFKFIDNPTADGRVNVTDNSRC